MQLCRHKRPDPRMVQTVLAALLAVSGLAGCDRIVALAGLEPPPAVPEPGPALDEPEGSQRARLAAVLVQFVAGRSEPGADKYGEDRLRAAAVFADIDRRDADFVGDLVGVSPARTLPSQPDTCVRVAEPLQGDNPPPLRPRAWVQLLDIGNVELRAGTMRLPLRVKLLPNLVAGARGIRYDLDVDRGRAFLANGALELQTTGGDGVPALQAKVQVPRPVRISQVGGVLVRGGMVALPRTERDLVVQWGSIDGTADLELRLGSEQPGTIGWLRCRLLDDGEFRVPAGLLAELPPRSAERPWLLTLVRSRRVALPGFSGLPWLVALSDATRIH
jgi:hypothetical protein